MGRIVIGTRGSELALWQAGHVMRKLRASTDSPIEIRIIKTSGDRIDDLPFSKMEGKGFFTKELEQELLTARIDLAVHSMKDLQTTLPEGLSLGAVCSRSDPRDMVLIAPNAYDETTPLGVKRRGTVGTSSVRRQCQIAALRPDLEIKELRGNVPTRIGKLRDGRYDAVVLAHAGVIRLDIDVSDLKMLVLDADIFMPAPAQGILAVEVRDGNDRVREIVSSIDDTGLRTQVELERGLLARFEGGCQLPLGALSEIDGKQCTLRAVLGVRKEGAWDHLRKAEAAGTDPQAVISEVYRDLTE